MSRPSYPNIEDDVDGVRDNLFVCQLPRRYTGKENLSRTLRTLKQLMTMKDLKVIPADKKLGQALMTGHRYKAMYMTQLKPGQYKKRPSEHLPMFESQSLRSYSRTGGMRRT